jgi:hypothetical protein
MSNNQLLPTVKRKTKSLIATYLAESDGRMKAVVISIIETKAADPCKVGAIQMALNKTEAGRQRSLGEIRVESTEEAHNCSLVLDVE